MGWDSVPQLKFFRTLRFRLASTFLLMLALVLAMVSIVGTTTLRKILESESNITLLDELGALKGYIHFEGEDHKPYWFLDQSDPEENAIKGRLSDVFVIADERGNWIRSRLSTTP